MNKQQLTDHFGRVNVFITYLNTKSIEQAKIIKDQENILKDKKREQEELITQLNNIDILLKLK